MHVHGGGIGAAVEDQQVGVGGIGRVLTGARLDVQVEGYVGHVAARAHDAVGHDHIGLAFAQVVVELGNGVRRLGAVRRSDAHGEVHTGLSVHEGAGGAEGEVVQQERVVQPYVHGGGGSIRAVVDHLHAGSGNGCRRKLHKGTTAGERGPEPEGRAIAVLGGVQEARGHHHQGGILQTERGQRRAIGRHNGTVVRGPYLEHVISRGQLEIVGGEIRVAEVVEDGRFQRGTFEYVHRGRVGAAMEHEHVRVPHHGGGFTSGGEHLQAEGGCRGITASADDAAGHDHIGLVVGQREILGIDGIAGSSAVRRGDPNGELHTGRSVHIRTGGAELEVVQQQGIVQVNVHHGRCSVGAVVDHLDTSGLGVGRRA